MPRDGTDPSPAQIALGAALRRLRDRSGLTQADASFACGLSPLTWARWEAGTRSPALHQLTEVADAIHATPEELARAIAQAIAEKG